MSYGRVLGLVLLVVVAIAQPATAALVPLLFAGEEAVLIIDGNGNGPGPEDCAFYIAIDFLAFQIVFTPVGDTSSFRACTGTTSGQPYFGSDTSSDYGGVAFTSDTTQSTTTPPGLNNLIPGKVFAEAISENPNGPANGFPLEINEIDVRQSVEGDIAFINVCNLGGPALLVHLPNMPSVLFQLSFFTDTMNQTYLRVPKVPWERGSPNIGSFALADVYLPTNGHTVTAAMQDAPDTLLVNTNLDALAACQRRTAAPVLNHWGLSLVLLGLLAAGSVLLGRRRGFASIFPTAGSPPQDH